MPMKKLTLKEIRELGIPIYRSYFQFHQKPLPNQKLKKFLNATNKQRVGKNVEIQHFDISLDGCKKGTRRPRNSSTNREPPVEN